MKPNRIGYDMKNPHETFCLETATHFVAVRGRGNNRTRQDCATMEIAEAYGADFGDKRTMVYAVNANGNSAHIRNV